MSHKRRKQSEAEIQSRLRRNREVRDLYNRFRNERLYLYDRILDFFDRNYTLQERTIMHILKSVDDQPVEYATASIQYSAAMDANFKL